MYCIYYMSEDSNGEWKPMWVDEQGEESIVRQHFDDLKVHRAGRGYFLLDHDNNVVAKKVLSRKQ